MKPALRTTCLATLPLALALAACGEEKEPQQDAAAGEILPGSASDAMLPYDTVRSRPPLAPMAVETGASRSNDASDEPAAEESSAAPESTETPAASAPSQPSPSPQPSAPAAE